VAGLQTCELVANELAAVDVADAGKQRPDVILRHRLRQVVDNQVCQHRAVALVAVGITAVMQHGLLTTILTHLHDATVPLVWSNTQSIHGLD